MDVKELNHGNTFINNKKHRNLEVSTSVLMICSTAIEYEIDFLA